MKYKNYDILATARVSKFWPIDPDGNIDGDPVKVNYEDWGDDGELWYAVVDEHGWCVSTFETVSEAKQFIREYIKRKEAQNV